MDQKEREQAMEEAEKILMDEMGCIPLYNSIKAYVANPKLVDVVMSKMGTIDFKWADLTA